MRWRIVRTACSRVTLAARFFQTYIGEDVEIMSDLFDRENRNKSYIILFDDVDREWTAV